MLKACKKLTSRILKTNWNHKTKLFIIKFIDVSDKSKRYNNKIFTNLDNVEEINFDDVGTQILVNAKLFLDINKFI